MPIARFKAAMGSDLDFRCVLRSVTHHSIHTICQPVTESFTAMQEESAAKKVKNWRGPAAVWLSFGTNSFTDTFTATRSSLETTFAYEPVAAKVSSLSVV